MLKHAAMPSKTLIRKDNAIPLCRDHNSRTGLCLLLVLFGCLYSSVQADKYSCPKRCACTGPDFVPDFDNTTDSDNVTEAAIVFSEEENVINCSSLGLSRFPPDINSDVTILDLSFNGIDLLPTPRALSSLKNLKMLYLQGNRIHSPVHHHAFQDMRSMVVIDLSHNNLVSLPKNVFESCENLEIVRLSGNKRMTRIPSLITDSVKELDLSGCGITNSSGVVFSSSLTWLSLRGNPLGTLPGDIPISSKQLETLDVRSCSLSVIHREALSKLPSLVTLRLSGNRRLSSVSSVRSDSLRRIEAVDCSLGSEVNEDAPLAAMSHLTFAFLSGNSIQSLGPISFSTNELLVELDLSRNGLKNIGPRALHPLVNLRKLNLSRNVLSDLEYSVFANNHHLVQLDLSHNPRLSYLPSLVAYSLVQLDASDCGISQLGNGSNLLSGIPNLSTLDLCYNPLEDLPIMASQALRSLDLAFCRLSSIKGSQLAGLSQLDRLVLVGNRISYLDPNWVSRLSYLAISDNPWNCACKDQDFLELWSLLERMEPQGQPLHCAPDDKSSPQSESMAKEPGEGLRLWSDVCYRSFPVTPSHSSSAMWSVFVALLLTLAGVIVAVVVYRHWSDRRKKEMDRRNAAEAENRIQRLRRRGRRSDSEDEEGGERRTRHRDVVTVRRRREEPRASEPPPYEEAVLMPRPEEVEVTLVSTPVDRQELSHSSDVNDGGQLVTQGETQERNEECEGQEQGGETGAELESTWTESPC